MIEYTSNREWSRDLQHLGTSWTLRRVIRAPLGVGVYAAAVSFVMLRLVPGGWGSSSGVFSLLGVILSLILAFRTNTAYERWWEGRTRWGELVNHSRNLAIQLDAALPAGDRGSRPAYARLIGNFALALSGHLRGRVDGDLLTPTPPGEAAVTGPGGLESGHVPAHLARAIVARVHDDLRDGSLDATVVVLIKPHTQALLEIVGACERIRNTPIPFSYSVSIKLFIVLYAAILPVGLALEYGYLGVPLVMLIVFALLGLELMAEEIEDPFGLDCNDLPTGTLAAMIRSDVSELLGIAEAEPEPAVADYSKRS